jgi:hypothetical protein
MLVVRLAEGLVLAVLLPLCLGSVRRSNRASAALAGVYAVYTILPVYGRWQAWGAALICVLCAPVIRSRLVSGPGPAARRPAAAVPGPEPAAAAQPEADRPGAWERARAALRAVGRSPYPLFALPAAFGAASVGGTGLWRTLWRGACDDRLAVTVNGVFAAVFVGGLLTGLILRRFSGVTENRAQAVLGAGTLLGWLERMLYFSFLLAGQPTAAAFALTAKSAARFPALQRDEEGLAEYYLIGSLSSLVIAVVTALLTRLALGMAAV